MCMCVRVCPWVCPCVFVLVCVCVRVLCCVLSCSKTYVFTFGTHVLKTYVPKRMFRPDAFFGNQQPHRILFLVEGDWQGHVGTTFIG